MIVVGDRNLVPNVRFNFRERHHVGLTAETDRIARSAGARGAAYTMHIVFRVVRQVIIDNVLNIRYVQAA